MDRRFFEVKCAAFPQLLRLRALGRATFARDQRLPCVAEIARLADEKMFGFSSDFASEDDRCVDVCFTLREAARATERVHHLVFSKPNAERNVEKNRRRRVFLAKKNFQFGCDLQFTNSRDADQIELLRRDAPFRRRQ